MPRFFAEILDDGRARIRGADAVHIQRSLRRGIGDEVLLRDHERGYRGVIAAAGRDGIELEITAVEVLAERTARVIHLGMCLIASKEMDAAVRFAAELGVSDIQPLVAERSNLREVSPRRRERWRDIVLEGVKQSQRRNVPAVEPLLSLEGFAGLEPHPWPKRLVALEGAGLSLREVMNTDPAGLPEVGIVIGPEGGFSLAEQELLTGHGFAPVHMGHTTLRAITAALAAVAALGL